MPGWLSAIPSRLWAWMAGGAAVVGAVLAGLAQARRSGVADQVAAQARQDMEATRARIDVENDAARVADPNAELHRAWKR